MPDLSHDCGQVEEEEHEEDEGDEGNADDPYDVRVGCLTNRPLLFSFRCS